MKKIVLAAASATALFAVSACAEGDTTEETTIVEDDGAAMADTPDTYVVEETDANGDSISISEDGVTADITDGDTSVSADVDGDPSLEVQVD